MDFTTRADVAAPAAFAFAALSDFAGYERAALRRGAEVARSERPGEAGPEWRTRFRYAGKPRELDLRLDESLPPERMRFALESRNLRGELLVELHELARGQTRVLFKLRLKPVTVAARVMLQGLRLGKARVQRRMHDRLAATAEEIGERYRREAGTGPRGS